MTDFVRTPDSNFADLDDFPFEANYHWWQDLRMHYLDEGPKDGPVMLLMHGMPTWSYLYRDMIPPLVKAGYRCIAPDHLGFGKSDKPTDIHWYTIARHTEVMTSLLHALDLQHITLVCQDWGGPIGLAQAAMTPARFDRLIIMNTWLDHPGYEYSNAIKNWNRNWHEGGIFARPTPNIGALMVLSAGLATPNDMIGAIVQGTEPALTDLAATIYRGFIAPFRHLDDAAYNGLRRFPLSIPLDNPDQGNAAAQNLHYETLLKWTKPTHFIWGCKDDVFTEAWGRTWAARMNASFDPISEASHFLQNTHGAEISRLLLRRIFEE